MEAAGWHWEASFKNRTVRFRDIVLPRVLRGGIEWFSHHADLGSDQRAIENLRRNDNMDQQMSDHTISAKTPATLPDVKIFRAQLGEMLKKGREKAGMSQEAVAQVTRITGSFVAALESGQFEHLPGAVFGRGFVRSIARVLDLDAEELSQIYTQCWVPAEIEKNLKVGHGQGVIPQRAPARRRNVFDIGNMLKNSPVVNLKISSGKSVALLVAVPLLALVVAGITAGVKRNNQKVAAKQAPVAEVVEQPVVPAEVPVAAEVSGRANEEVAAKPVIEEPALQVQSEKANFEHVLELVVIEPVKIKLTSDNNAPSARQLKPDAYRFTFTDRAELTVYDAAAVEVAFNGRSLGSLGTKGRIRRLIFQSGNPESASNNPVGETAKKL